MFFSRKIKNRRLQRFHVLDVKVRSQGAKAGGLKRSLLALSAGGLTLLILFTAWQGTHFLLEKLIYTNPTFAVQEIEVETDGVLSPEQIRKWSRVRPGQNVLKLDLSSVKQDLEVVPWIEGAAVERQLPNRLHLKIRERVPVAQLYGIRPRSRGPGYDPVLYHIDSTGFVMEPISSQYRLAPPAADESVLPLISGGPISSLRPLRRADLPQISAALKLVDEIDFSPMAGLAGLKKIDLSIPEILQVSTDQGGDITLGIHDLEAQLMRWRSAFDYGQRHGKAIAFLDLSIANNIPARWMEPGPAPMTLIKPQKAQRPRKRNV